MTPGGGDINNIITIENKNYKDFNEFDLIINVSAIAKDNSTLKTTCMVTLKSN
jgi:hypothetical protein